MIPTKIAILMKKLKALADRPGTPGEGQAAQAKLDSLIARYGQPEPEAPKGPTWQEQARNKAYQEAQKAKNWRTEREKANPWKPYQTGRPEEDLKAWSRHGQQQGFDF